MADGGLTIELSQALAERLKEAAEAAGRSADDYASELIEQGLSDDWAIARVSLADYDLSGDYVDARAAMAAHREELVRRLDRRR